MALADRADDAGVAWPSIPWICEWTCLGRTTVIESFQALESAGLVVIVRCQGRNNQCSIDLAEVASRIANPSGSRTGTRPPAERVVVEIQGADQSASRTGVADSQGAEDPSNPSASRTRPVAAPVRQPDPHPSVSRTGVVRIPDGGSPAAGPDTSINTNTPDKTSTREHARVDAEDAKPFTLELVDSKPAKKARRQSFDALTVALPPWLDRETWELWVRDRNKRGKAISEDAARLQLRTLDKLRGEGYEPADVIEHAVASGWQGLYAPPRRAGQPQHSSDGRGRRAGPHHGLDNIDHDEGVSENGHIL